MSAYNTFAVAGTGYVGVLIIKDLAKTERPIKLLTRSAGGQVDKDVAALHNVTVASVDYGSEASLVDALRGVDVVVSTLSGPGFAAQTDLIRAAKKADVKLFISSQFGIPASALDGTKLSVKVDAIKLAEEIGLPSAHFSNGPFMEYFRLVLSGGDPTAKKLTLIGKGDTPLSTTSMTDVARFVTYVLTKLPPHQIEGREFRIQGELTTLNQAIATLKQVVGQDVEVVHRDLATAKAELPQAQGMAAYFDPLFIAFEEGRGDSAFNSVTNKKLPLDNGVFPDWNPRSFAQIVASGELK